jgi:uncharacterized damage-inducible protein DinB
MPQFARLEGFRGEFLWELEIAARQLVALAEAFPAEKYDWRPDPKARSVSEVFVHVGAGIFMLLDLMGITAPADLYGQVPAEGQEHFLGLIRSNDILEATVRDKAAVIGILKRALEAASQAMNQADGAHLEQRQQFFYEDTTVRRVYLRLLTHTHEHMGQMIAYLRFNGIGAPWQDWRPDRRNQS